MRNKHSFRSKIRFDCPHTDCGKEITKTIVVDYVTNQRGDVIEKRVRGGMI